MHIGYKLTEEEFCSLVNQASEFYKCRVEKYMLRRSVEVVEHMFTQHNRIFAFRLDLRFAQDHQTDDPDSPLCFQRVDPQVITRFLESLKARLKTDHKDSGRKGDPSFPAYVWTRERNTSEKFHYHVMLMFNRDVYGYLGDYTKTDASNMANRIQKAWCSAVGLDYPDFAPLVHFPEKSYRFSRSEAFKRENEYSYFLLRLAYLAKENTKFLYDSSRNFGTSQT